MRCSSGLAALYSGLALITLGLTTMPVPATAQGQRAIVRLRSQTVPVALDTIARFRELAAPPPVVYHTVRAVLEGMGLRVSLDDSAQGVIGNLRWNRSASVAGERPSRFLNCGAGLTGPNADTFRLTLAFAGFVDPSTTGGTRLGFALIAEGQTVTGTGGKPSACESLGVLEAQVQDVVRNRLRGQPPG